MDTTRAQQIREAFGACTSMFECHTPEDVIENFKHINSCGDVTEAVFCRVALDIEGIHADREAQAEGSDQAYKNWLRQRAAIVQNLAAIGIVVP
jgi:hypothetical protein